MSVTNAPVTAKSCSELIVELVAGMRVLAATPTNADPTLVRIHGDIATDMSRLKTMAGLAAIVLVILTLSVFAPTKQVLIALLELACYSSVTSAVIGRTFARASRVAPRG